ncbi:MULTISPECIES: NACHT domain-containing protein [Streptomyces]|uniref:NACHT domain-containing protein n=1 Tax=Streptomyces TaxID=1883 RepID=UPI000FFE386A|nr:MULTISPECIES: NACHT domain-containing protein [Streptomyces]
MLADKGSAWGRRTDVGATGTGQARAVGGVAVSGALIVEGGVRVTAPGNVAQTGYREQIRRIAPQHLQGREEELAALATFCNEPGGSRYLWLRGPAWAGKSALLSWFALHPPEGMHLVPFFITGRFASQNDRTGFCDVVMEQLAAFLGQPMPAQVTEATREGHLLTLIHEAAHACQENNARLVLIVDGLDEDQGVTTRPESYSIAALLPSRLLAELRVIVASRPHPPIPADVPDDHPLRDPSIIQEISVSPYAEAVKADAERELQRLADSTGLEQEILGLITVADGGLSEQDLAELTDASPYTVRRHVHTVAGRTFASMLSPLAKEEVYVLGHDELRSTAVRVLSSKRMACHRERLHQWADGYRDRGWPACTPEYLLNGYFRALRLTNDLPRVIAHATDATRHNRMLQMSGGDADAFAEVRLAGELVLEQKDPDLVAMASLAVHHEALKARNNDIPVTMPAMWAALGDPERAEAVLNGIVVPDRHNRALLTLLETYLSAGHLDRAHLLAETAGHPGVRDRALADAGKAMCATGALDSAEAVVRQVEDPRQKVSALSDLVEKAMHTGQTMRARQLVELAEQAALSISKPKHRAAAIRSVTGSLAYLGDWTHAVNLARTISHMSDRAMTLCDLTLAAALAGDHTRWETLAAEAEAIARCLPQPGAMAKVLATLARKMMLAGHHSRATDLAEEAATLAQALPGPGKRAAVLVQVVHAVAATGDPSRARMLAHSISVPDRRIWALLQLVKSGVINSDECLQELSEAMKHPSDSGLQDGHLIALARAVNWEMNEPAIAEAITEMVRSSRRRIHLLFELGRKAAIDGTHDRARTLGARAEAVAQSLVEPQEQVEAMVGMAHLDALLGDSEQAVLRAEKAQARLRDGTAAIDHQTRALLNLARTVMAMGDVERARALGHQAARLANDFGSSQEQAGVQTGLIDLAISLSDLDWAETVAQRILEPFRRAKALIRIARAMEGAGAADRCLGLIGDIETLTISLSLHEGRCRILAETAKLLTLLGDHERAESTALKIQNPHLQARAFLELAAHTKERHTRRLLARVLGMSGWAEHLADVALMAPWVVKKVADQHLAAPFLAPGRLTLDTDGSEPGGR